MEEQITALRVELENYTIDSTESAEEYRLTYTVKKGKVNQLFENFRSLPKEEKAKYGKLLNELKQFALTKLKTFQDNQQHSIQGKGPDDMTLPGDAHFIGSRHPISITLNKILDIFTKIGFTMEDGPEIEDDWHNFGALNLPEDHPARDMQDTFFVQTNPDMVLRTHTSNVQIRTMETQKPPIRILAPGRVYRNETISARSHCFFPSGRRTCSRQGCNFPGPDAGTGLLCKRDVWRRHSY